MIPITKDELNKRIGKDPELPVIKQGTIQKSGQYTFGDSPNLGKTIIPEEARPLVQAMTLLAGHGGQREMAAAIGVDENHINRLTNGLNWKGEKDPERVEQVKNLREKISERDIDKVGQMLGLITEDRLKDVPVKELTEMTKDISVVVRNVSGDANAGRAAVAQVFLFAPPAKDERKYDIVDAEISAVQ